jgi:hypothetical protein
MIGPSSRITVVTRSAMRLCSGSGSVCAAGHQNGNHVCSSLPQARREYLSMASRICKVQTGLVVSLSRNQGTPASSRRATRASTESTCLLTETMPRLNRSSPWLWSKYSYSHLVRTHADINSGKLLDSVKSRLLYAEIHP